MMKAMKTTAAKILTAGILLSVPLLAQAPPYYAPAQLDTLVEPVALYPDPLLAQTLTAATYWDQIPQAAQWADEHSYLQGQALANAIQDDQLPWDPSVLALLPFPSVLDPMARDPGWTQSLGNAVLGDRGAVMDAVQRMRREAMSYGYLQSNQYYRVVGGPYIEIMPMAAGYFYVPVYNPRVVFTRPARPVVGAVINFGPRVQIGAFFQPYGWRQPAFAWGQHNIIIDNHPWVRTVQNRATYQHSYVEPIRRPAPAPAPRYAPAPGREGPGREAVAPGREAPGRAPAPAYVEHHDRARDNHGKAAEHGRGPDHERKQ
jgi:hypothetical protein